MAEESQDAAQTEVKTPEPGQDQAQAPAQVETPVQDRAPALAPAPPGPEAPKVPWQTRRIDELTKNWREEERRGKEKEAELAIIRAENEALRKLQQGGQQGTTAVQAPQAPTTAAIQAEAAKLAAQNKFNEEADAAYSKGIQEYKDFDDTVRNWRQIGGLSPQVVAAALETGVAHRVLYGLGKDLDEASRILSLPPMRQAVAIAKYAEKLAAPPKLSAAPKPIEPVGGTAGPEPGDLGDQLSIEEWMNRREKQVVERRKQGLR